MLSQPDGRMVIWADDIKTLDVGASNDGRPPALTTIIQGTNQVIIGSADVQIVSAKPLLMTGLFCGQVILAAGTASAVLTGYAPGGDDVIICSKRGGASAGVVAADFSGSTVIFTSSDPADTSPVDFLVLRRA